MMFNALNFPAWDLGGLSGGLLIASIAVIHVFVAQISVGAGFFLVMAERKGHRENSAPILDWVQKHASFFLLLSLVFGGLTGVGIWLVISLVAPAGTSLLIREFVFAWAAEWVFFLAEILTLLVYSLGFKRVKKGLMSPRDHMLIGLWYAVFAFLSLFVINGIISFMLTPGQWLENGSFWSALFNPSYWPSLVFRFGLSLCLAGMFGLITATAVPDQETRESLVRFCAQWICLPFVLMVVGAIWYTASLPEDLRVLMQRKTADIRPFIRSFLDAAPILFLAGMFLFIRLPRMAYKPYVALVLLLGLITAGSFEFIRETSRRPWLIYRHMYSNGITVHDGTLINDKGILGTSGWAALRAGLGPDGAVAPAGTDAVVASDAVAAANGTVTATVNATINATINGTMNATTNATDGAAPGSADRAGASAPRAAATDGAQTEPTLAGPASGPGNKPSLADLSPKGRARLARFIYTQQCSSCHGLGGPRIDLKERVKGRGEEGINALLAAQGLISPYMPPFFGTEEERRLFAAWLAGLEKATDQE